MNRRFNLEDYETVDQRLAEFHQRHPNGRIVTHIITLDEKKVVMRAEAYRDDLDLVTAVGHAQEVIGSNSINANNALENCETSAVGRALRNLGVSSKGGPSREEMQRAIVNPVEETRQAAHSENSRSTVVWNRHTTHDKETLARLDMMTKFDDELDQATSVEQLRKIAEHIRQAGLPQRHTIELRRKFEQRVAELIDGRSPDTTLPRSWNDPVA